MTSAEYLKELKKERNVLRVSLNTSREQTEKFEIRRQLASLERRIAYVEGIASSEPQYPEMHMRGKIETPEKKVSKGY